MLAGLVSGSEPLTNEIIIKMVQAGVPTETIVRTIQSAESFHFGTLPGDLIDLQQANVPEEIVRALAARINYPGTSWRIVVPVQITPPPAPAAQEKPVRQDKPVKTPKINASAKPAKAPVPVAVLAGLEPVIPAKAQRPGALRRAWDSVWNTCASAARGFAHIF
jgi:hypothetical protein